MIPSTDVIQLTLTLKMTTAQVVETSVTVNNNSPTQDYVHPDNQTQPTFEIIIYLIIIYLPDWGKVQQGAHSPAKYCISSKVKHHPDSHYISDLMMLRQMY